MKKASPYREKNESAMEEKLSVKEQIRDQIRSAIEKMDGSSDISIKIESHFKFDDLCYVTTNFRIYGNYFKNSNVIDIKSPKIEKILCQLPTGLACGLVKSQLGNCPVGRHMGD